MNCSNTNGLLETISWPIKGDHTLDLATTLPFRSMHLTSRTTTHKIYHEDQHSCYYHYILRQLLTVQVGTGYNSEAQRKGKHPQADRHTDKIEDELHFDVPRYQERTNRLSIATAPWYRRETCIAVFTHASRGSSEPISWCEMPLSTVRARQDHPNRQTGTERALYCKFTSKANVVRRNRFLRTMLVFICWESRFMTVNLGTRFSRN